MTRDPGTGLTVGLEDAERAIWYITRYGKGDLVNYSTEKNILKAIFSSLNYMVELIS